MPETNTALAQIFRDMSAMYQYMGGAERFRTLAYLKAARVIGALQADVTTYIKNNTLEDIDGIGAHIADKIKEFVKTGKIKKYEELKTEVPMSCWKLCR